VTFEEFTARAFRSAHARDANVEIARAREEQSVGGKEAVSYEVVADVEKGVEALAKRVLPQLIYFLDCRGFRFPAAKGVFVTLFAGEQLHFIDAAKFVTALGEVLGLSVDELIALYGAEARDKQA
jgi:hypothetical protein